MLKLALALTFLLMSGLLISADSLPQLPPGTIACHGTVRLPGQDQPERFWMRLAPPDARFGGNRMLQVVFTPPPPAALGGSVLGDVPFLLLDGHGRVVAWNDRTMHGQVVPGTAPTTYAVTRDRTPSADANVVTSETGITGERAWDRVLVPFHLALTWRSGSQAQVRLVDLFGDDQESSLAWIDNRITWNGATLTITADSSGRVQRLTDADGTLRMEITAWELSEPQKPAP